MRAAGISTVGVVLALLLAQGAWAAAGSFQFVEGAVDVIRPDGRREAARKGGELDEGDTVASGRNAHAQILMDDESIIAVRPETQLRIETFRYAGAQDQEARSIIGLLKGTFRTITGRISRLSRGVAIVRTPNATIGVRGTDHEPAYVPPPAPGEIALAEPGTYDKVNEGAVYIETAGGRLELGVNEIGFAAAGVLTPPVKLQAVPEFFRGAAARPAARAAVQDRSDERAREPAAGQPSREIDPRVPLPPAIVAAIKEGDIDPRVLGLSVAAARGLALTGGDLSPDQFLGSGAGVVGAGDDPMSVLVNSAGMPVAISSRNFSYARNNAAAVDSGQARTVDGADVRWGIYAGGSIVDTQGHRDPKFFHVMAAKEATVVSNLSGTATFGNVQGFTKPINESGDLGGRVIDNRTAVTVDFNSARVVRYDLSVVDARGVMIDGQYSGNGVALSKFLGDGGLPLNTKCVAGCSGTGSGSAHGVVVGPQGGGLITSYDMKAGGKGVTGSVLLGR